MVVTRPIFYSLNCSTRIICTLCYCVFFFTFIYSCVLSSVFYTINEWIPVYIALWVLVAILNLIQSWTGNQCSLPKVAKLEPGDTITCSNTCDGGIALMIFTENLLLSLKDFRNISQHLAEYRRDKRIMSPYFDSRCKKPTICVLF